MTGRAGDPLPIHKILNMKITSLLSPAFFLCIKLSAQTFAGPVIVGNGCRIYTAGGPDGVSTYGDFRTNTGTGNTIGPTMYSKKDIGCLRWGALKNI